MSPTSSPSHSTRIRRVSVTAPIADPLTSHLAHTSITPATLAGSTTHSIRSWDSLTITSKGSIPGSRNGTFATSRSIPTPPFDAISEAEEVRPAAPRSCSEMSKPRSSSSSEHSSSFFSSNGSPTWTVGRLSWPPCASPDNSAEASTEAPPIPSRPVDAPNNTTTLPGPAAALRTSRSRGASPRAMALTRQLCSYGASKYTSPPTVGTPIEFP
jgi:hypothetical protein